jgi:alcohol dehydrogenase
MKAAVLDAFGEPLAIQALPDPAPGAGQVVVDMAAAGVTSYAANIFNGSRNYALELPVAPGAGGVGRVRATGPDATRLKSGDWVFCEPTIRSRDHAADTILQGWTYRTQAALPLHRVYHHGSYAEQMLLPIENVTQIGDIEPAQAGRWCALSRLLVPYGGLLAGDLKAGETLVANGATGGFGGAGVAVALAMGAGKVVAAGRNARSLEDLARRFGPRVRPAQMSGVEADDRQRIIEAAGRQSMSCSISCHERRPHRRCKPLSSP